MYMQYASGDVHILKNLKKSAITITLHLLLSMPTWYSYTKVVGIWCGASSLKNYSRKPITNVRTASKVVCVLGQKVFLFIMQQINNELLKAGNREGHNILPVTITSRLDDYNHNFIWHFLMQT